MSSSGMWSAKPVKRPSGTGLVDRLPAPLRRTKWLQWFLLACPVLVVVLLAGMIALLVWPKPVQAVAQQTGGLSASVAQQAVNKWLGGSPPPLPGGILVGWQASIPVDFTPVVVNGKQQNSPDGSTSTRQVFDVIDGRGAWWQVSVQITCDTGGVCQQAGDPSPSLLPQPGTSTVGVWPGLTSGTEIPDPVGKAIQMWSDAFFGNDPAKLSLAVGDPDQTHTYQPLGGGATATTATPTAAAPSPTISDTLIVQTRVAVTWPGSDPSTPWGFDLLIERASTPAPLVVAWGPCGSGPTLTPYDNAEGVQPSVTGTMPTPSTATPATPAPSPAPTDTTTGG